jgi:geranylgeranyl diphosphate synthase type I
MRFKDFLHDFAKQIDTELESFFTIWSKDIEHVSKRLVPLTDSFIEACSGGKRIRGALVMLGYEMGSDISERESNFEREIVRAAAAYEVFQTAILAHDDVIDKSVLRRGRPSLYTKLGGKHDGVSKAICLGDIGFFLAFKMLEDCDFPVEVRMKAMKIFSKGMLDTGIGELLDVEMVQNKGKSIALEDILTLYNYKTAKYTFSAPLAIGASLAGVPERQIVTLKKFGQNLGIAFQIKDDINDIFMSKKYLGKEQGGDIREGKLTLTYLYALENVTSSQSKILKEYYGKSFIDDVELEMVKKVFIECGALEYSNYMAEKYRGMAKESITEISVSKKYKDMLFEMSEYLVKL